MEYVNPREHARDAIPRVIDVRRHQVPIVFLNDHTRRVLGN
jgi:hypothetical protein